MLLEYGAKNFFSFKEGIEISFRLKKGCSEEISMGKNYSTILCVKGANASGKTNALKVLSFLSEVCCNSFNSKPEDEFRFETYFFNKKRASFFVEFCDNDNIEFRYELELNKKQILRETLFRKKKKTIKLFDRIENSINDRIKEFSEIDNIKLRNNASIISTAYQYELPVLRNIYIFFFRIILNINYFKGLLEQPHSIDSITSYYYHNKNVFEFAKDIIKKCDLGIVDIEIEKRLDGKDQVKYIPLFVHESKNNKKHNINYYEESSGTRSLYGQLFKYFIALEIGGVLVLDEFDINLHPDILPFLIQLFTDNKTNKKNAQLLFTTHNSNILNTLGKYRTVLVNKDENESYLYRLDEIPGDIIRNDRPIEPVYRSGKIGGVPRIYE